MMLHATIVSQGSPLTTRCMAHPSGCVCRYGRRESRVVKVVKRCRFWWKYGTHHAEFVADRVRHDYPRNTVVLADIGAPSSESLQTADFFFL